MRKPTVLTVAISALLTAALWQAPAFADDTTPPAETPATTEAPADASAGASTDAAPAEPAGEVKPAE